MHFTSDDNRQILDGTAGLWCVNAGHGRKKIQEAVTQQIEELETSKFVKITPFFENCFIKAYKSRFLRLVVKCASRDGFVINSSSKAELGRTYYFDHPMFGILVSLKQQ